MTPDMSEMMIGHLSLSSHLGIGSHFERWMMMSPPAFPSIKLAGLYSENVTLRRRSTVLFRVFLAFLRVSIIIFAS